MDVIVRGEGAAKTEERAVQLMWDYHTAAHEELGEAEVARRRAAYLDFTKGVGHDPLSDA